MMQLGQQLQICYIQRVLLIDIKAFLIITVALFGKLL